ncbi:unnamed protein product [Cuscuta epithymum]|uniref:F-box domain-containing protein n=1 Tax=Cuscuta epithymum TaxID=186058 RepID=A0AAV0G264_9ASTE|nr:unnamed protein product [Cuscuta epithymum]
MNPAKMSSGAPFLPLEIISDVLKRLPVKSLIRFQSVCNLWKNLLKSPSFIASHLDHSNRENLTIIFRRIPYSFTLLYCLDGNMQPIQVRNNPFIDRFKSLEVVGCCNGLLCIQTRQLGKLPSLYLWNPAIREVREVPRSRPSTNLCYMTSLGFAFCPTVKDYKIVIPYVTPSDVEYGFEVYSLATTSWKNIKIPRLKEGHILTECITSNGSMFWFATKRIVAGQYHGEDNTNLIASLYLAMDEFRLIPPPPLLENRIAKLTVYENKLAVFHYSQPFMNTGNTSIDLWVIEEGINGSWSKILTCNPYPHFVKPLTIWRNQIVFSVIHKYFSVVGKDENDVAGSFLFDPTSNEVKVLYWGGDGTLQAVFTYVESLVLISNIHTG